MDWSKRQLNAPEELYQQFITGGEPFLDQVVADGWSETLILDFKQAAKNTGPMEKDDRKGLGKELSAFANSEGGVIVWGIRCDAQTPDEADTAKELKPITNLNRFLSDLHRNTSQMTSPPVSGVLHRAIQRAGTTDAGYIVTLVPKSEGLPVMAKGPDQYRFYFRSGSSSLPMETFMLADRFGRRPQPELKLGCRLNSVNMSSEEYEMQFVLAISNIGRGIAHYPALTVYNYGAWTFANSGLDGAGAFNLQPRPRTRGDENNPAKTFAGGNNDVIFPGTQMDIVRTLHRASSSALLTGYELLVKHDLYCDGFSLEGAERRFSSAELQRAIEVGKGNWL